MAKILVSKLKHLTDLLDLMDKEKVLTVRISPKKDLYDVDNYYNQYTGILELVDFQILSRVKCSINSTISTAIIIY